MNVQTLRHFVAVADLGSLGRASETLNISQTGLTKSIQRLERAMGVVLFRRTARGMIPTRAGETLLPHARLIVVQTGRAASAVSDLMQGADGSLAIGAAPEWLRYGVRDAVLAMHAEYPGTSISVSSGRNTRSLAADLRAGRLDLVVGISQMEDMDGLEFEPLVQNRQGIIVANTHPLAHRDTIRLHDLVDCDWVLPGRSTMFRARLDAAFAAEGLALPCPAIETDFMPFVISCVANSRMIGTATDALIAADPEADVLLLDAGSILDRPMGFLWRVEEPITQPQLRFMAIVRRLVRASGPIVATSNMDARTD